MIFYSNLFYLSLSEAKKGIVDIAGGMIRANEDKSLQDLMAAKMSMVKDPVFFDQQKQNFVFKELEDLPGLKSQLLRYKQSVLVGFLQCLYAGKQQRSSSNFLKPVFENCNSLLEKNEASNNTIAVLEPVVMKGFPQENQLMPALFDTSVKNRELVIKMVISSEHFSMVMKRVTRQKFRQICLYTRTFLSSTLDFVFMIVKGQRQGLLARAEMDSIQKQLELGVVDLGSFEPLDSHYRPFRIKTNLETSELAEEKAKCDPKTLEEYLENAVVETEQLKGSGGDEMSLNRIISAFERMSLFEFQKTVQTLTGNFQKKHQKFFTEGKGVQANQLLTDSTEDRESWSAFLTFIVQFNFNFKITKSVRESPQFKMYRGLMDRLVVQKSLMEVNRTFKTRVGIRRLWKPYFVRSLWNIFGIQDSQAGFTLFRNTKRLAHVWKSFEVNELNDRDILMPMERIKLVFSMISNSLRLFELIDNGLITECCPLHDPFLKNSLKKAPLFVSILDSKKLTSESASPIERDIKKTLSGFKEVGEVSDFSERSLVEDCRFVWTVPWFVSVDALRDYFGEKLALYFEFSVTFTKIKLPMAIVGLIVFILQQVFMRSTTTSLVNGVQSSTNNKVLSFKISSLVLLFFVLIWTFVFVEWWKQKESSFKVRYGVNDDKLAKEVKPGFYGNTIRDPASNDFNFIAYPESVRFWKSMMSLTVSIVMIAVSIGVSIGIVLWRKTIDPKDFYKNLFPILVNAVFIVVWNLVYRFVAVKLTNFENHKALSEFEDSLILKLFLFNFANTFNSYIVIAFIKPYFPSFFGKCIQQNEVAVPGVDCFNELSYQVQFVFILQFFLGFLKVIIPFVLNAVMRFIHNMKKKVILHYEWQLVDSVVESESILTNYGFVCQLDFTLFDYLNHIIELCFLSFFSISFPFVFVIAFIGGLCHIQMDKYRFLHLFRRPYPVSCGSIGLWRTILNFIAFLSVICNACVFCFTLAGLDEGEETRTPIVTANNNLSLCVLLIVVFTILRFLVIYLLEFVVVQLEKIELRHKHVMEKILEQKGRDASVVTRAGVDLKFPSKETKRRFRGDNESGKERNRN